MEELGEFRSVDMRPINQEYATSLSHTHAHTQNPHTRTRTTLLVYAFALTSSLTQANGNLEGEFGDRWAASGEKYLQRALLAEEKLACALDREWALQQQVIEVVRSTCCSLVLTILQHF